MRQIAYFVLTAYFRVSGNHRHSPSAPMVRCASAAPPPRPHTFSPRGDERTVACQSASWPGARTGARTLITTSLSSVALSSLSSDVERCSVLLLYDLSSLSSDVERCSVQRMPRYARPPYPWRS